MSSTTAAPQSGGESASATPIEQLPSSPQQQQQQQQQQQRQPQQQQPQHQYQQQPQHQPYQPPSIDPATISHLMSDLKQAANSGATQLPSAHIPMDSAADALARDPHTVPTYIQSNQQYQNKDYIRSHNMSDTIQQHNRETMYESDVDYWYNEMRVPAMLVVLYFLFQMPFFKRNNHIYFPSLFAEDGNYNFNGLVFTSACFGALYIIVMKIIQLLH